MTTRNIKLIISYDGTRYKGWQLQTNGNTVQAELEKAVEKALGKHSRVTASGRTDAGVHARGQVANFKTPCSIPAAKVPVALNTYLPGDIAVLKAEEAAGDFHSQYDARSKRYRYFLFNSASRDPFAERYAWRVPYRLNIALMKREARALLGRKDFKSFQASDKKERSSVRTVSAVSIRREGAMVSIDVESDGFLYNMVRNIVGTLVDIGRGYLEPGSMTRILGAKDRREAGPTAPPQGLFLVKVSY